MAKDNSYYSMLRNFPLLSQEEEVNLSKKIKSGDNNALNALVKSNLRLVVKVAKHYTHCSLDFDDLVSEGNIGLISAARAFDSSVGVRFSTFATPLIRNAIVNALRTTSSLIRTPDTKNGRKLRKTLSLKSLDTPIATSDKDTATLLDTIKSTNTDPLTNFVTSDTQKQVSSALKDLNPRSKEILRLHYGIGCKPLSLSGIGDKFSLSKERVRQLESGALLKLSKNPVLSSIGAL